MKIYNNGKTKQAKTLRTKVENFRNSGSQWQARPPHIANSILFFAWAVSLWAIFAVPIFSENMVFVKNLSVYGLLQQEFAELLPIVGALITLAAAACVYAILLCLVQLKCDNLSKWIVNIACFALYAANIACSIIFAVKLKPVASDIDGACGCFPVVNIAVTLLFAATGVVFLFKEAFREFFRRLWKAISYPYKVYACSFGGLVFGAIGTALNLAGLIFTSYLLGAYGTDAMSVFLLIIMIFSVVLSILATFFSLTRAGVSAIFSCITCFANAVAVMTKCVQERFVTPWITPTILSVVAALMFMIALLFQIGSYEYKK